MTAFNNHKLDLNFTDKVEILKNILPTPYIAESDREIKTISDLKYDLVDFIGESGIEEFNKNFGIDFDFDFSKNVDGNYFVTVSYLKTQICHTLVYNIQGNKEKFDQEIYNNILEYIEEHIQVLRRLDEEEAMEDHKAFSSDPYGYYGHSVSDFL